MRLLPFSGEFGRGKPGLTAELMQKHRIAHALLTCAMTFTTSVWYTCGFPSLSFPKACHALRPSSPLTERLSSLPRRVPFFKASRIDSRETFCARLAGKKSPSFLIYFERKWRAVGGGHQSQFELFSAQKRDHPYVIISIFLISMVAVASAFVQFFALKGYLSGGPFFSSCCRRC